MNEIDEFLEHFGVKGMKWGVRRRSGSDGRVSGSAAPKAKDLTDADLRAAVNRMQMERQYNTLIRGSGGGGGTRGSRAVRVGAAFVAGLALTAMRSGAQSAANHQVEQQLRRHGLLPQRRQRGGGNNDD